MIFLKYFVKCRFGEGTQIIDDGFFDELQFTSNKNLEVQLVVLSIVDSCQYV